MTRRVRAEVEDMLMKKGETIFPRRSVRLILSVAVGIILAGCGKEPSAEEPAGKITSLVDFNRPDRIIGCESEILATREAKKRFPQAQYQEYQNYSDCVLALASGKVCAVVN
ncbi:MAG: hypothetical protein MJ016_08065, partial [Victivallaceae bacterium]|nr:hypothetical protein [Victivallaceae bacterium]